ncbi:MAG TPA: outer membrane protein transport protein [Thiobacillus sp.]|nr:MAG: hypothetical protein B7Y21_01670 [Hydrogenophilales bacterium 16-61-112]OZA47854.1 MAG: hypothetical protein B7X81_04780 [Hydrogenophilales bacterium 17-61-76]HQT30185.1 outer membrane protein transport protein [Thiobacillus sp.]HQT69244.1 outer membrane protein transport protein [Thiobacillus sp.]
MRFALKHAALVAACLTTTSAQATNGFFLPGSGVRSTGMGGVGIAYGRDSLSANANPVNILNAGMRGDMGISIFNPERYATVGKPAGQTSPFGGTFTGDVESESRYFLMPEMGFAMPLTEQLSIGLAVVGSGGMNTNYPANFFSFAGDPPVSDRIGVDMMQVLIPISVAYKVNEDQGVGASLVLATTRFQAYGLGAFLTFDSFTTITSDEAHMTNNGYDYSYGGGVKLGWQGEYLDDKLTVGLVYTSRIAMTKFDKYRGLFAEQGGFDIPENYGIGIAIKPMKNLVISADVSRINFADVKSFGNLGPSTAVTPYPGPGPSTRNNAVKAIPSTVDPSKETGNDEGMGFGWQNQTVYKLGIQYGVSSQLQVRAGYNYGASTIPNNQLTFNTLAPATVERHISVGFTYKPTDELEITGTYMRVPNNSQTSPRNQNIIGMADIGMSQNVFGVSLGWMLAPGVSEYGDPSEDQKPWGFYAGMGIGQTSNSKWESSNINASLAADGITATSDLDNTNANGNFPWKFYAGYEINQFFGVEGGYMAFQDLYANVTATAPADATARLALQSDAWMLAAMGSYPVTQDFSVFGKLGANFWRKQLLTTDTTPGVTTSTTATQFMESDGGRGLYYALGASYDMGDYFTLRAEWERYDVDGADVDAYTGGFLFKF